MSVGGQIDTWANMPWKPTFEDFKQNSYVLDDTNNHLDVSGLARARHTAYWSPQTVAFSCNHWQSPDCSAPSPGALVHPTGYANSTHTASLSRPKNRLICYGRT